MSVLPGADLRFTGPNFDPTIQQIPPGTWLITARNVHHRVNHKERQVLSAVYQGVGKNEMKDGRFCRLYVPGSFLPLQANGTLISNLSCIGLSNGQYPDYSFYTSW